MTGRIPRNTQMASERAKVADFYAARSRIIPPLPGTSFAPPFSGAVDAVDLASLSYADCHVGEKLNIG